MTTHVDLLPAFLLLLAGSFGLVTALAALVVGRKLLRDRREAASARRRDSYRAALGSGDRKLLRRALGTVRSGTAEVDLATVLAAERLTTDQAVLNIEARRARLVDRLERRLRSRRAPARGRAVLVLAHLRRPGHIGSLGRMLDDDDPDVRLATCAGLPLVHDQEAVDALIVALSHRHLAPERVIERLGFPWAVDPLLEELRVLDEIGERRSGPRVAVARSLGMTGDSRAEPALIDLLRQGHVEERISAARALGEIGGRRARNELERALRDESWPLRAQAAKALGQIAIKRSVPALEAVLGDPAWWVRANAGTALRALGAPGRAALDRALAHDDAFARDRAREELAMDRLAAAVS
jgi:HEAT repeat protein